MALSSTKDFWIHPNALTITLNYFGDQQLIQTLMLAGAVIMAYNKDYIGYDAAHNYREWKLQAFPTQLNDTCAYYVHAELSRDGDTAMVIYSPVKRDIEGMTYLGKDDKGKDQWDTTTKSDKSWFIYLGEISASVDSDGATVDRAWVDGIYTGTLATDQQRLEDAQGDWALMFQLNEVTDLIDVLKTISSATINALTVAKNFIFGGKTFTAVAGESESGDEYKRNDATLPTTGYVAKEIEALDEHFLIKDGNEPQSVGGDVSFDSDVAVEGNQAIGGNQTVGGDQSIAGNQTVEGSQEVIGLQILHEGFTTENFNDAGGQITGAQLTRDGLFSVAGLIANSFTIKELIYNVIRAQSGEYVFSPTVNIERCSYVMKDGRILTPDEYYTEFRAEDFEEIEHVDITLRNDECTHKGNPLRTGDIVYGYVNNIGESGKYSVGGQCLMHVTHIDGLYMKAVLYRKGDRGVVANIPPADGMCIAQRGTEDANQKNRMTSFYISAESGSVIMLDRVTSPTLSAANYGAIFGKLPTDLLRKIKVFFSYINETDPVVYARYGIFENLLQFDHLGNPIQQENNRGEWSYDTANDTTTTDGKPLDEESNTNSYKNRYKNLPVYYDTVTHKGELWKCIENDTTDEPGVGSGWLLLVASTPIYDFRLSNSTISVNADGVFNTNSLSFSIGESVSGEYNILDKEEQLAQRHLKVQYSINGRIDNDGSVALDSVGMALEDNSGFVLTEDGLRFMLDSVSGRKNVKLSESGYLMLEAGNGYISTEDGFSFIFEGGGGMIPVDASCDMITLYLVDTKSNLDRLVIDIPVIRDGLKGDAGPFKSTVFTRDTTLFKDNTAYRPSGGTYKNPIPEDKDSNGNPVWHDGIPEGFAPLYSSHATFYGDGTRDEWSKPKLMADSADFEVLYSPYEFASPSDAKGAIPRGFNKEGIDLDEDWLQRAKEAHWYDNDFYVDEDGSEVRFDALWMATNSRNQGGRWNDDGWVVSKVKGEKGEKGDDGDSPITFHVDPPMLTVRYGDDGSEIIEAIKSDFVFYVKKGNEKLSPSSYEITKPSGLTNTGGLKISDPEANYSDNSYTVNITRSIGDSVSKSLNRLKFSILLKDNSDSEVVTINVVKSMTGKAGPAGEKGAMLLHEGDYDPTKFYKLSLDEDRNVFGKPCVYLKAEEGDGTYLILKKSMDETKSVVIGDITYPADDEGFRIDEINSEYWSKAPYQDQVFAKFIMANYAEFGSDKGAIFYDRFLFSRYGINREGNFEPYSEYVNVMWDKDGNLTGEFMPSLMIDMYAGYAKTNKLAETFQAYRSKLYANEINFYETYNVKCNEDRLRLLTTPQANDITDGDIVLIPSQVDTRVDGVRSIILNMADRAWSRSLRATLAQGSWQYSEHDEFTSFDEVLEKCMLVCPEPRLFNPYAWKYTKNAQGSVTLSNAATQINDGGSTIYEVGRFVIDGKFTDCVILEPGMQLNLRSCRADTQDETLYWYVENSEDFVELPYGVRIEINSAYDTNQGGLINIANGGHYHEFGWESYGISFGYFQRSFVSRNVYELFKSKYGTIKENARNFRLVVNTQPSVNAVDENWKWEQDVIGITYGKI